MRVQPKEGQVEDVERAKQAAKLMSRSSKFNLSNMPEVDIKAWEIKRSDVHIELKPDGSKWLLGAGGLWQGACCHQPSGVHAAMRICQGQRARIRQQGLGHEAV